MGTQILGKNVLKHQTLQVVEMGRFVEAKKFEDLSREAILQLKNRILDTFGVAIGALASNTAHKIRELIDQMGGNQSSSLMGGGKTAPDRAAFYNGMLGRYLDFNDSFLASGETCHPSDNLAPVLAAAEYADASGKTLLVALAIAYQVQIRLSEVAPVRAKGFDHVTQGAYAVAAGVSKALGLDADQTANAIAMSGTANNALRITRTGRLSNWKGLAYPQVAFSGTHCTLLAKCGITGPIELIEGVKGFQQTISGPFWVNWRKEDLESVLKTVIKRYNAEVHSQSAIAGILEMSSRLSVSEIDQIEVDTFQVAYDIIGGGEEGDKLFIQTKEQADHSLAYLLAVAVLDRQVLPAQFMPERIIQPDVQSLMRKIKIRPDSKLSAKFPREMPTRIRIHLKNGKTVETEKNDFEGFVKRPMSRSVLEEKFRYLAETSLNSNQKLEWIERIGELENLKVKDLTLLFTQMKRSSHAEEPKSIFNHSAQSERKKA